MLTTSLVPLSVLKPELPAKTPPGSLLVSIEEGDGGPQLRFNLPDTTAMAIRLDQKHERAFQAINVAGRHKPVLYLDEWLVRVDPLSSYTGFDSTPQPGDIFVTDDETTGLVLHLDHGTRYVSLKGNLLSEPNFSNVKYVGFRAWAIGRMEGDQFEELVRANFP